MNHKKNAVSRHVPNLDDRQAAERTLCKYFSSFGIDAIVDRERLIDPFIERAAQFWRGSHGANFASLALDEAETAAGIWFADVLAFDHRDEPTSVMTGRAAFMMCDGPTCFAHLFLLPIDQIPAEFIDIMRHHAPITTPPSDQGDMHHQPYEAWSLRRAAAKAPSIDKWFIQLIGDLVRRDGRTPSFISWRNTGPTS